MRIGPIHPAGFLIASGLVGVAVTMMVGGCVSGSAVSEVAGVKLGYDPARAFKRLDQIKPDPPAPKSPDAAASELSPQSARRLGRAQSLLDEQRFTEAGLELEKALRRDPNHPGLHRLFALSLRAAGNPQRSRTHLRRAEALDPDDLITHYLLGRLAFDDQQNEEAVTHYRIALKSSNADTERAHAALTRFYLAKALNAAGYLTAAIEQYRAYESAVASLPPDQPVDPDLVMLRQINHGRAGAPISVAYEKLGRFAAAAEALWSSFGDGEPDPTARERLARLLVRAEKYDEALEQARRLVDRGAAAIELLVYIHQSAGHSERIVEDIASIYENHPDNLEVLMAYVDALERMERVLDARAVLEQARAQHPERIAVSWRLCDIFIQERLWADVLETAAAALRLDDEVFDTARAKLLTLAESEEATTTLLGDKDQEPEDADTAVAFLLGSLADRVGRRDQAVRLYRLALAGRLDFVPARVELAEILLSRFAWQEAIDLVSADVELLEGNAWLERLCGQAYAGLDDYANAEAHLQAAVRLNSTDTEAMAALGHVHLEAGRSRRGQRQFEAILDVNPLDEASREALIEIHLGKDRQREAAVHLEELIRRSGSPHRIARCTALVDLRVKDRPFDRDAYRKTLQDAIDKAGPDGLTCARLAQSYRAGESYDEAIAILNQALASKPDDVDALEESFFVHKRMLAYDAAVGALRKLLRRHPHRFRWVKNLLDVLLIDHRFDDAFLWAAEQLQRPNLADNERRIFRARAIESLDGARDFAKRVSVLQDWRRDDPDNDELVHWLVEALLSAKRIEEGVTLAWTLRERDQQDASARFTILSALVCAGRYDRAQQMLLEDLEVDPDSKDLQRWMIRVLAFAGRHEDALEWLDNLAVGSQSDIRLRDTLRGERLLVVSDTHRYKDVVKLLTGWLREAKSGPRGSAAESLPELQLELADALMRAGRVDDAIAKLGEWIEENEDPTTRFRYHRRMSLCQQWRDDSRRAIDALERAYEIASDRVGINNDLGYSLADAGIRLDEAEWMVRRALVREPHLGAYLDSYGWVLYKRGEFAESRRWLEKSAHTLYYGAFDRARFWLDLGRAGGRRLPDDGDPVVYDHLGDVHWRLGNADEAADFWAKSVELCERSLESSPRDDLRNLLKRVGGKLESKRLGREPAVAPLAKQMQEEPNVGKGR